MSDETHPETADHTSPKETSRERIEIRELELEDLPQVYQLGERLFTAERWPNLYRTWDEYELVSFFSEDGDTSFVADMGGTIVGFALGTMLEKRRSAWVYGYLVWLGVDPTLGRRGIAARLLKRLTHQFIENGARMLLVDTDPENHPAVSFFKKQGFGNEREHVFLTRNLSNHPEYQRLHGTSSSKKDKG